MYCNVANEGSMFFDIKIFDSLSNRNFKLLIVFAFDRPKDKTVCADFYWLFKLFLDDEAAFLVVLFC